MEPDDISANLENVFAMGHRIVVCKLVAVFIREGSAIEEVWLAKHNSGAAGNGDLRGDPL